MFNDNKYAFSSIPNAGILETLATNGVVAFHILTQPWFMYYYHPTW